MLNYLFAVILASYSLAWANECSDFKEEIPPYFVQGNISVPENWDHPEGRKIEVFYYGQLGTKKETPIVFFNGGPTASSHVSFGQFQTETHSSDLPILYIDQRGTGCSTPYPSELSTESVERLSHYGSRSIVKDAEAIRRKLLHKRKWRVFGQSYGGLIAHRYLEVAPGGIQSLHIHGNTLVTDWADFYSDRLLSQKRVSEEYLKVYPRDRSLLVSLKEQIPADLCFSNESLKICGSPILDAAVLLLGFQSSWDNLHTSLHFLIDKESHLVIKNLGRFASAIILEPLAQSALPPAVIAKLEMNSGDENNQCREALRRLEEKGEAPEAWLLNECRLANSIQYIGPQNEIGSLLSNFKKKDPLSLELTAKALQKNSKIKMFLYSGNRDVYVPVETYKNELKALGTRVNYTNFEFSGHDGYLTEPLIWNNLKEF